jgi:hypothetical protein
MEVELLQWKQEILFIKRDANGVIVAISERTPEGYVEEKGADELQDKE